MNAVDAINTEIKDLKEQIDRLIEAKKVLTQSVRLDEFDVGALVIKLREGLQSNDREDGYTRADMRAAFNMSDAELDRAMYRMNQNNELLITNKGQKRNLRYRLRKNIRNVSTPTEVVGSSPTERPKRVKTVRTAKSKPRTKTPRITDGGQRVNIYIAQRLSTDEFTVKMVAKDTGISDAAAFRYIKVLLKTEVLEVRKESGYLKGGRTPTWYGLKTASIGSTKIPPKSDFRMSTERGVIRSPYGS